MFLTGEYRWGLLLRGPLPLALFSPGPLLATAGAQRAPLWADVG